VEVLFERVAGLDIGKASLTACVRTPGPRGRSSEVRTFATTARVLEGMRDWLLSCGVTVAAMESTSTYWKAPHLLVLASAAWRRQRRHQAFAAACGTRALSRARQLLHRVSRRWGLL
jgi:hypothetical protein